MTKEVTQDRLNQLFDKQLALQNKLGYAKEQLYLNQQFININFLALMDELSEALRETSWKNPSQIPFGWKNGQKTDLIRFKHELIDILHFYVNLCISSGMSADELFELYTQKNKENHERKEGGY